MKNRIETLGIKKFFSELGHGQSDVIASFGGAKLINNLNGKFELVGGSDDDRIAAREWISLFMDGAVTFENEPSKLRSADANRSRPLAKKLEEDRELP